MESNPADDWSLGERLGNQALAYWSLTRDQKYRLLSLVDTAGRDGVLHTDVAFKIVKGKKVRDMLLKAVMVPASVNFDQDPDSVETPDIAPTPRGQKRLPKPIQVPELLVLEGDIKKAKVS